MDKILPVSIVQEDVAALDAAYNDVLEEIWDIKSC